MCAASNSTRQRRESVVGPAHGSRKATTRERVEQAVTADDTCLSGLIQQPLERRTADELDDGPSHRRWGAARKQPPLLRHKRTEVPLIFDVHTHVRASSGVLLPPPHMPGSYMCGFRRGAARGALPHPFPKSWLTLPRASAQWLDLEPASSTATDACPVVSHDCVNGTCIACPN